jgi:hypothetical protein
MQVVTAAEYRKRYRPNVVISESGRPELAEEWDFEPEIPPEYADDLEVARKRSELVSISPSHFTEFAVKIPINKDDDAETQKTHDNFNFKGREYLRMPYDTGAKRRLFKCGRQVEKSTLLGNTCLSYCCIVNAFNVLYVSPTNQQTKTFSRDRLKEPLETSDLLKSWTTTKLSDNVFEKQFINRSKITLRYAYHNADRTRGIPADMILIDEVQDIITDNIPIIEECASHSHFKLFVYSGTPKSLDNAIEKYWNDYSTQNEWVVPCERHGTPNDPSSWHWNILSEDTMEEKGLVCDKCHELINPMHPMAQWASMNPKVRQDPPEGLGTDGAYEGFRIPQLMVPWLNWSQIWVKKLTYPRGQFYNEVLGLSYDSGLRPLTQQDVKNNCKSGLLMSESMLADIKHRLGQSSPIFAGIDWGTGEGSYTVLTLGAYIDGFFTIFYIHRFEGQELEPPVQLGIIEDLLRAWNVDMVGCDYGGGYHQNDNLQRKFGTNKIVKYQYSNPGQKVKYEPDLRRFLVNRTEVMSDFFNAIKRANFFRFPDWAHFEDPYASDFLSIFSEYNEQRRQIEYKHAPDKTDDSFHSSLYCFLASMLKIPAFHILNPTSKVSIQTED